MPMNRLNDLTASELREQSRMLLNYVLELEKRNDELLSRTGRVIEAQQKEIERLRSARGSLINDLLHTQDIASRMQLALEDIASADDTSTLEGAVAIAEGALAGGRVSEEGNQGDIRQSHRHLAYSAGGSGCGERSFECAA